MIQLYVNTNPDGDVIDWDDIKLTRDGKELEVTQFELLLDNPNSGWMSANIIATPKKELTSCAYTIGDTLYLSEIIEDDVEVIYTEFTPDALSAFFKEV